MYQMTIGTDKSFSGWIELLDKKLRPMVKDNGVVVIEENKDRILLGIGVYNDINFEERVSKILCDFYLLDLKEEYLYLNIRKYRANNNLTRMYVKVLKMFNTHEEKKIFTELFRMYPNFSLDGFYKFRFGIVKEKWNDLLLLSYNNLDLLCDDKTLIFLIRYLLTCLPKTSECVYIDCENADKYKLSFRGGKEFVVNTCEEVAYILIENTTNSIIISRKAANSGLVDKINSFFDVKIV